MIITFSLITSVLFVNINPLLMLKLVRTTKTLPLLKIRNKKLVFL